MILGAVGGEILSNCPNYFQHMKVNRTFFFCKLIGPFSTESYVDFFLQQKKKIDYAKQGPWSLSYRSKERNSWK